MGPGLDARTNPISGCYASPFSVGRFCWYFDISLNGSMAGLKSVLFAWIFLPIYNIKRYNVIK